MFLVTVATLMLVRRMWIMQEFVVECVNGLFV